jgi:hypothetical protein
MTPSRKHTRRAPASAQAHRDEAEERNEQLRQSLKDAAAALIDEVRAGKSARLEALLTFESRFHQYSANNIWLIALQCPHAERVAGHRAWEQLGYHVAKGQKAIRILAPRVGKHSTERVEIVTEDAQGTQGQRTTSEPVPAYFTYVPVFDVSQLDPAEVAAKPLPSFYHDLGSDAETTRLMAAMETCLRASGVRVTDVDPDTLKGDTQGWSKGKLIGVRAGLSSRNRLRTLCHEWAHEVLHQGAQALDRSASRAQREHQAEATSYVVLHHFGIRNTFSADYVQSWGATPDLLMAQLALVQKAATHIITRIEAALDADTTAAGRVAQGA